MIYHAGLTSPAKNVYCKRRPGIQLKAMMSFGRRGNHNHEFLTSEPNHLGGNACDSGTWTRNQNPKKYEEIITIEGYKRFLNMFEDKFDFYLNFDADFSRDGFDTNLQYQFELEDAGFKPVPVIHDCYGIEIQYYLDKGYPMVAIGSGELRDSDVYELRRIVDKFYSHGVKVHFLGCTEYEKLAYTPVYSCDSSTWIQSGNRDYVNYWNTKRAGIDKTDKIYLAGRFPQGSRKFHIDTYQFRLPFEEYLWDELQLGLEDLTESKNRKFNRQVANIHYFVKLEQEVARRHRDLGFKYWI
jgi:hypothetical protein